MRQQWLNDVNCTYQRACNHTCRRDDDDGFLTTTEKEGISDACSDSRSGVKFTVPSMVGKQCQLHLIKQTIRQSFTSCINSLTLRRTVGLHNILRTLLNISIVVTYILAYLRRSLLLPDITRSNSLSISLL
jgi:hypothetical protein